MKIELNKQQYRKLIELLFLGDWLANASRTGSKGDELITDYKDIEHYILSFSKEFQLGDFVMEEKGEYFTTMKFEEELTPLIDEYDEYTFWEQLAQRLAERDLMKEIGPVRKLKEAQIERQFEIEEIYHEEFEKNGLKNLLINKTEKKKT
jgi:hypothetical protein